VPRIRRPNATFSATLSHGISACFWNTDAALGARTRDRLAVEDDLAGRIFMNPAMHDRSVVLPQPEAPSATTKSPGSSARLTSDSAWSSARRGRRS
jgi:hypothetical protein